MSSDHDEGALLKLLKGKLPPYVVNCLQAAGYAVPEVIVDMDITQGPGNTITQIEKFIEKRYTGKPSIMVIPAQHIK